MFYARLIKFTNTAGFASSSFMRFFSSSVVGAIAVVVVACLLAIAVFFSPIIIINDFNYFIARSFGAWVLPIC